MSASTLAASAGGIELPNITPENVREVMEAARVRFMEHTREMIKQAISQAYTQMCFATELLYVELEAGSKELTLHRELLFLVNSNLLSDEKWKDIVQQIDFLRKEKVAAAEAAKKHMQ